MRAFVVLGLVFSIPSQEIGLGKRVRNDLFCVEWGVKQPPHLSFSLCLCVILISLAVVNVHKYVLTYTHTHTRLTALFPGLPR